MQQTTQEPLKLNFGEALEILKNGGMVKRDGWNGKGMWLELQVPDEHSKMTQPYIYMCIPKDSSAHFGKNEKELDRIPWLASQTDMLAEDWIIVR